MLLLQDIPYLREDLEDLRANDPQFASYEINLADLPWDCFEPGFEGLTRSLQSQQISVTVADILWYRLKELGGGQVTPEFFLSLDESTLRNTGFTRQKASYMKGLCEAIQSESYDAERWDHLSDQDVVEKIVSLRGFGLWTAQTFLLFSLQRRNIYPYGDLVADRALQALFNLPERPKVEKVKELIMPWEGKLTAITLLLWHLYVEKKITL